MEQHEIYIFIEDLLWCPSQIYYYFISNDQKFCIYLRWRYKDPWTAELVKCNDDWEFNNEKPWKKIKLDKEYKDKEYKDLEREVLEKIESLFPNIDFPNKSKDITYLPSEDNINKLINALKKVQLYKP